MIEILMEKLNSVKEDLVDCFEDGFNGTYEASEMFSLVVKREFLEDLIRELNKGKIPDIDNVTIPDTWKKDLDKLNLLTYHIQLCNMNHKEIWQFISSLKSIIEMQENTILGLKLKERSKCSSQDGS